MIKVQELEEMYATIANDLNIESFDNESITSFHNRIIYSAIGKWIMQLFADRDFEEDDFNQVSKSHVTISALDVLSSYKKIDDMLVHFFVNDKETIKDIENIYVVLGYINSGNYTFKYPIYKTRIAFSKETLVIDLDTNTTKMRGLGLWDKIDETNDMPIDEFFLNGTDAITSFKNLAANLNYSDFNPNIGKIEVYNVEKKRWDYFNEKITSNYEYYILKIDDGLDYQILRKIENKYYSSSVPTIYTKKSNDADGIFVHEIWRIILGLCSYNNKPAICKFCEYSDCGIKMSFKGYILPFFEYALLKCMAWPIKDANGINDFVTDKSMKESIKKVLSHLSIEVVEGDS